MNVTLVCASAQMVPIQVQATYQGQTIEAQIPGCVYELISSDGSFSITLRGELAAGAALEFAQGQTVTGVFTAQ